MNSPVDQVSLEEMAADLRALPDGPLKISQANALAWAVLDNLPLLYTGQPSEEDKRLARFIDVAMDAGAMAEVINPARQADGYGTLFEEMCRSGYDPIVSLLLERGAAVNGPAYRNNTFTPLMVAVAGDCQSTAELLVRAGADIHLSSMHGGSAMSIAVSRGCHEIQEWLHSLGARTDQVDKEGRNLLHHVFENLDDLSQSGACASIRRLMLWGVDIAQADNAGRTPRALALDEAVNSTDVYLTAIDAAHAERIALDMAAATPAVAATPPRPRRLI